MFFSIDKMNLSTLTTLLYAIIAPCTAVRLQKLFQLIDLDSTNSNLQGFHHVGNDYSVFLQAPSSNDKYLTYELYETVNEPNTQVFGENKPTKIAISEIPIQYIKDQLLKYRDELNNATVKDSSVVPGTQVQTVREWQIEKALRMREENETMTPLRREPVLLRTLN